MDIKDALKSIIKPHEGDRLAPLSTVWGERLDKNSVLSEYPRPQLKRESFLCLNGLWDYAFTTTKTLPEAFDGRILVPFSPECSLSGVNSFVPQSFCGIGRSFPIWSLLPASAPFCILARQIIMPAYISTGGR